jgi:PAP2 superfamily
MKNPIYKLLYFIVTFFLFSCHGKSYVNTAIKNTDSEFDVNDPAILRNNQKCLTDLIIYDVFTPPVAARIYAYTSLAAYEAVRFSKPSYPSLTKQLKGFGPMPQPQKGKEYNYLLAASAAFFTVAYKVTFSTDTLKKFESKLIEEFKNKLDTTTFNNSIELGGSIGKKILARAALDNYPQTRGKPRFMGSHEPGKWRPTPPDYLDAVESCWGTMKCFILDTSTQFMPAVPPAFNMNKKSVFYKNLIEVYNVGKNLTEEQKKIAAYWDDNPFVIEHSGHMMFANKKITPGGHWMGIALIACKKSNVNEVKTAQVFALTAIALMEGFIACWDEKYRSQVIRPVTVINELIDEKWIPFLQTPPFPEYPSGHSTISASAAVVLTKIFGDNYFFHDDSDKEYIGMEKDFTSFYQAAEEVSVSRVNGGIHYPSGVEAGANQGKKVGKFIIEKIKLTE